MYGKTTDNHIFTLTGQKNKTFQQAQPQPFLWQEQLTLYHPQRNIIHFITLRQFSDRNNNHVISSSLGQLSQSETTREYHFKTISLSQTSSVSLSENVLWQKQPKVRFFFLSGTTPWESSQTGKIHINLRQFCLAGGTYSVTSRLFSSAERT